MKISLRIFNGYLEGTVFSSTQIPEIERNETKPFSLQQVAMTSF